MMDAKLIYIKSQHLLPKVMWEQSEHFGWKYCGRSADLNEPLLQESITKQFGILQVHLVTDRHESRVVESADILRLISVCIDGKDLIFWNLDFTRVMEVNKIGVYRMGSVGNASGV